VCVCIQFDKWSTSQRLSVVEDLVHLCRRHQLQRISDVMSQCKLAPTRDDFTYCLSRSLSLQIFSYLDPRSLCRCAQVVLLIVLLIFTALSNSGIVCIDALQFLVGCCTEELGLQSVILFGGMIKRKKAVSFVSFLLQMLFLHRVPKNVPLYHLL